jgi:hypothetical protein
MSDLRQLRFDESGIVNRQIDSRFLYRWHSPSVCLAYGRLTPTAETSASAESAQIGAFPLPEIEIFPLKILSLSAKMAKCGSDSILRHRVGS